MVATDITLTHASVNSGSPVYLQGTSVKYGVTNMMNVSPVEGSADIAEVNVGGFGENPVISVEGMFDVENNPANTVTHSLLLDFKQVTTPIQLIVTAGTTPQFLKGRPTAGYSLGGTYLNQFSVYLKSFDITFSPGESSEGKVWRYNAVFVETKE